MKLITTIIISLIFILSGKAELTDEGAAQMGLVALAVIATEVVIVYYGTSVAIDNIKYLSDNGDQPSKVAGYIWGGLNMTSGIFISIYAVNVGEIIGIAQIVLGAIDIGTTVFIDTKSNQIQLTYAPTILIDSNKKPVMGFNIRLAIN